MISQHANRNPRLTLGSSISCASRQKVSPAVSLAAYRLPPAAMHRRGVLLLVVLILLVMFVLMAVTYVLVTTRELSSNKALAIKDASTTADAPQQQLDEAMRQLRSGSTNTRSVIYPHSLLEHMYGPYGITGTVNAVDANGNATRTKPSDPSTDEIVEFTATNPLPTDSSFYISAQQLTALQNQSLLTDGYFDGCVITMTSGQASGLSSRIVRYDASNSSNPVFHVLAFKGNNGNVAPASKDTFVINGRAFSGTGRGLNPTTGVLDAADSNLRPFALLPNPVFYQASGTYSSSTPFGGIGGANTDYEAPDYQHMYLSFIVQNTNGLPQTILPSFHRPDLINYWKNQANPPPLRQYMLRPNSIDHPNFTGSNPTFDAVNGPWDVDNDGDGVADSVWLDLGDPVLTTFDGRLYKRLYAILCVDLDGRLNLNAAGTSEQTAGTHTQQITGPYAGGSGTVTLPRGEGNGPADIDLSAAGFNSADLSNLLHGGSVSGQPYPGRYGVSNESISSESVGTAEAGQTGSKNPLALVEHFQWTDDLSQPPFSAFGSPSDLWGRMAVALDFRGQPIYWKPAWTNEAFTNCPYNINLSIEGSNFDAPFTVHELERVLRPNDIDSVDLPQRLWQLSGTASLASGPSPTAALVREHAITIDSWDPPSPGVIAPDYLRTTLSTLYGRKFATNIIELLTARLKKENPSMTTAQINFNIRRLLSPELIAGLRMNVNRSLGDGRDGDNNGVVDEPTQSEVSTEGKANAWAWLDPALAGYLPAPPTLDLVNGIDVNGDGVVDQKDQLLARQLYARHLYVLARLMIDDNALNSNDWFSDPRFNPTDQDVQELGIRRIAQWATNVVDFMDPDNIMTPFEYDMFPFSATDRNTGQTKDSTNPTSGRTWCVDGIIDDGTGALSPDDNQLTYTWRRMVWGCERPELLLTETMAFHDRRVKDSTFDNNKGTTTQDTTNPDPTLDQVRIPQGSAFFELYSTGNPNQLQQPSGSPNQPQQSKDLYDNSTGQWMLDLGKMAPADSSSAAYPVWRLAITGPDANQTTDSDGDTPNDVQSQSSKYTDFYSYDTGDTVNTPASLVYHEDKAAGGTGTVSVKPPKIDRVVWFTKNPPPNGTYDVNANQIYYRQGGGNNCFLGLGQYAVVGPREVTRIGWSTNASTDATSMYSAPGDEPVGAKIVLQPGYGGVQFTDHKLSGSDSSSVSNYPDSNSIQPPLAIIAAADLSGTTGTPWDSGWSSNTSQAARLDTINPSSLNLFGVGISISEPLPGASYYQEPKVQRPKFDNEAAVTDCYAPLNETDPSATGQRFLDQPEDSDTTKDRLTKHMPPSANNKLPSGTYPNYKTVLLQRLANPLAPYNAYNNPYLTVDWMPIDLTVFNGQAKPVDSGGNAISDPDDPNATAPTVNFAARQRGGKLTGSSPAYTSDFNIWLQQEAANQAVDNPPPTAANDSTSTMVFPHQLKYYKDGSSPAPSAAALANPNADNTPGAGLHTFGFVNSYFQQSAGQGALTGTFGPLTLGEVNSFTTHVGDPRQPFPWLTWNNRPYANIAELMMVPATHPGRLLHEFSLASTSANPYKSSDRAEWYAPYGHLLNFFSSDKNTVTSPNLSLMFEYLRVPSPFVGTDTVLDPAMFAWNGGTPGESGSLPSGSEPAGTAGLHPPFSTISNYRDPGRVNINTIAGGIDSTTGMPVPKSHVWNALIGGDLNAAGAVAPGPTFTDLVASRRGYPVLTTNSPYSFDSAHPSIFFNPFRSAAGYNMVPLTALSLSKPTNATLFRTGMDVNGRSITDNNIEGGTAGLGDPSSIDNTKNVLPLMANKPALNVQISSGAPPAYIDATRNPYFMYQGLGHLTNKLTTRSNVFAVWITVGYFEVTPWYGTNGSGTANTSGPQVFDTAHPDGYQLGQELKADTGEIERHRAFYMIDRSIPVGFERGQELNDDKAVVLKRFIE
ncbi:MAG TPA: hypothetical protein VFE46_10000 [Pirellulales bacterium]|jgi:hypothetical protein|nr:hypothetical protein [Pirellulales bacterium]